MTGQYKPSHRPADDVATACFLMGVNERHSLYTSPSNAQPALAVMQSASLCSQNRKRDPEFDFVLQFCLNNDMAHK